MRIAILICLLLVASNTKAQYNHSPVVANASLADYSPHRWHSNYNYYNGMKGLDAMGCVDYCLIVGGAGIFFDGVFDGGSSNPDDRKVSDGEMALGAGCVATGFLLVYLVNRTPRYASNMPHKLERFCYTRQGYPRFCVATSYNGVGMGVNFK